jgi:hypothetical protein
MISFTFSSTDFAMNPSPPRIRMSYMYRPPLT